MSAMSTAEKIHLHIIQASIKKEKIAAFNLMTAFTKMEASTLKNTGHKSVEAALLYTHEQANKKITALIKKHYQKFPD